MRVHLVERVPGQRGALTVLEIEFTSKARRVRVVATGAIEPLDLRGERLGGTYDAAPTLTRLHVPLRVTEDGGGTSTVTVTVDDPAGHVAAETWEGTLRREALGRKAPSTATYLIAFGALAVGVGAFVLLPLLRPRSVPALVGKPQAEAERALKALGFAPVVEWVDVEPGEDGASRQAGRVVSQVPAPDAQPVKDSPVLLLVGRPSASIEVPQLVGRLRSDAEQQVAGTGVRVSVVEEDAPEASAGRVLRQQPAAGAKVAAGKVVELVVGRRPPAVAATGPGPVGVPTSPTPPPVEPPVVAMSDPPVDPASPMDPATPADPGPPVSAQPGPDPVATPTDPPVSPPVEPPVAPPVTPPVTPPVEPPVAPPVTPPVEPPVDPTPPVGVASVPYVVGETQDDAERNLRASGFVPQVELVAPEGALAGVAAGRVGGQDPIAGTARLGTVITLRVVRPASEAEARPVEPPHVEPVPPAPLPPTVPDLRRLSVAQAAAEAARVGIEVRVTEVDAGADTPDGLVLRQSPSPGAPLARAVTIDVHRRRVDRIVAPDLLGLSRAAAEDALRRLGVPLRVVEVDAGADVPDGLVLEQAPAAGDPVAADGVTVSVSRVAPPVVAPTPPQPTLPQPTLPQPTPPSVAPSARAQVPDLVGRAAEAAVEAVRAAGFTPRVQSTPTSPERAGLVLRQEPASGTELSAGSSVVIDVGIAAAPGVRPPAAGPPAVPTPPPPVRPQPPLAPSDPAAPSDPGALPPPRRVTKGADGTVRTSPAPSPTVTPSPTRPPSSVVAPAPVPGSRPSPPSPPAAPPTGAPPRASAPGPLAGPASGRGTVAVPDLVGRDAAEAVEVALRSGLLPNIVPDRDARAAAGRVRLQSALPGTSLAMGSALTLQVGAGASPVMVDLPSVAGLPLEAAVARLSAVGVSTTVLRVGTPPGAFASGVVLAQSPSGRVAGDLARVVRLYVADR